MDTNEEERLLGHSTEAALVNMQYSDLSLSLIDVPGSMKFLNEANFGISQAKVAVMVVSSLKTDVDKAGQIQ